VASLCFSLRFVTPVKKIIPREHHVKCISAISRVRYIEELIHSSPQVAVFAAAFRRRDKRRLLDTTEKGLSRIVSAEKAMDVQQDLSLRRGLNML